MRARFCKFLCFFSVIVVLLSSVAYAADYYGNVTTVDMRYDSHSSCRMPADTTYRYVYILQGSGNDFVWIGNPYVLIWSRSKLRIEDNDLVLNGTFYYFSSSSLTTIENSLFSTATGTTTVYTSQDNEFSFTTATVVYCNHSYTIRMIRQISKT